MKEKERRGQNEVFRNTETNNFHIKTSFTWSVYEHVQDFDISAIEKTTAKDFIIFGITNA